MKHTVEVPITTLRRWLNELSGCLSEPPDAARKRAMVEAMTGKGWVKPADITSSMATRKEFQAIGRSSLRTVITKYLKDGELFEAHCNNKGRGDKGNRYRAKNAAEPL